MIHLLRRIKAYFLKLPGFFFLFFLKFIRFKHQAIRQNRFLLFWLKQTGITFESPIFIDKGFRYLHPKNITLGKYVSLGHDNHFWAFQRIKIGAFTQTAKDLLIISGSHDKATLQPAGNQQVEIGAGCWVGARVTITGGVKIGKGVIIGAGSVVVNDIPDFAIVGGVPAKVLNMRIPTEQQWNPFKTFTLSELS